MTGAALEVRTVMDEAGLRALAADWAALHDRLAQPLPFQSPAWALPWWQAYHPGRVRVVGLWRAAQLLGVLPLYLTPEDDTLRPIGIGNSDYLDVSLDPEIEAGEAVAALWGAVAAWPDWTVCDLQPLPAGSALLRHLPSVLPPDCAAEVQAGESAPVLTLPSSVAALAEVVPRRMLRNLRNDRGRLGAAGASRFTMATGDAVARRLDRMIDLHAARWGERPEGSLLSGAIDRPFHHAAAQGALAAGTLRLVSLELEGVDVAVYYGFQHGPAAYAYLAGFDQSTPRLSLGTLVVGQAIEQAIADGAREFHFLRGREAYKYAWGAVDRSTFRLVVRRFKG